LNSYLSPLLQAYQSPNPADWVGSYRFLPTWAGIALAAVGLLLLLFGGGRAFRFVAGPLSALAGFLWMPIVAQRFELPANPQVVGTVSAAGLAAIGFAYPPAGLFLLFGVLAGLLASQFVAPGDWLLGFLPAFLIVGAVAAGLHRFIGAIASAMAGAWLLCIGMLTALHQVGGFVQAFAAQPWGVLVAAAMFAVAGSIYQIAVRPSPEEAEKLKQERARARRRAHEKKALEKRWTGYSARRED